MTVNTAKIVLEVDDCWNRIGVWSRAESRCPELEKFVHCRNCPRYSAAGRQVLARSVPAEYRLEWTERFAQSESARATNDSSALLFRLGDEWLALDSACVSEITQFRTIHSLPHMSNDLVKGLVNIRGELKICISIGTMLQVEKASGPRDARHEIHERMIYIRKDNHSYVFPVSEVQGIHRYCRNVLQPVPVSVGKSRQTFTSGILPWKDYHVGLIDHELLFFALAGELK
jgi:chemotaxis-related protein WspD